MKKILFTRHTKSSWLDTSLSDHDRPLNKRGIKSARILSEIMRDEFDKVQEVYVSSAKRAQETALELNLNRSKMSTHKDLCTFFNAILQVVGRIFNYFFPYEGCKMFFFEYQ